MFYNQNFNRCCHHEDNQYEKDCRYEDKRNEKDNKRQGCCVKYVQEVCCYPSYYNEDSFNKNYDRKDDKKECGCCQSNWNNCQNKHDNRDDKDDYKQKRCCCFCNRLFHW